MRFVQFTNNGAKSLGVELKDGGDIVDLVACDLSIPANMRDFIEGGAPNLLKAKRQDVDRYTYDC